LTFKGVYVSKLVTVKIAEVSVADTKVCFTPSKINSAGEVKPEPLTVT